VGDRLLETGRLIKKNFNAGTNRTRDRRISTGVMVLDAALGGGLPVGRNTLFWGEKSGGKSTSAERAIAVNQGLCRRCLRKAKNVESVPPPQEVLDKDPDGDHRWSAKGECDCVKEGLVKVSAPAKESGEKPTAYRDRVMAWRKALEKNSYEEFICALVDPEDAYEADWAEQLGVDDRRLSYWRPDNGQEASDIVQALVESGQVDLLVVDSLAHFTPREEIEEGAEKWQQGLQARILNKGIRGWVSMNARNKNRGVFCTQIWVNQKREKIGIMFGDPSVKPGGKGQDFAIHAEVNFLNSKVEAVSEQYGAKTEKNVFPVTETIRFKVTKNRTAATRGFEGQYKQTMRATDAVPAGTVLEDGWLHKQAMKYLVTTTAGKSKSAGKKYQIAGQSFTSESALRGAITAPGELREIVRDAILKELAGAR
jgi:RecA/RadA recombinase